ncbi:MAG: hypothetical protein KAY37_03025 [Phycisphaerae bacterium]|nr:hypothetical protein [Phycisphaerae bacterium]
MILFLCSTGCTYQAGRFVPNSQYAYPNSNIKSLGPVRAEVSKTWWIFTPELKLEDVRKCYNDALSQVSGANILINYSEDTIYTTYPILSIHNVKYVLEGEAARMTVGRQELR